MRPDEITALRAELGCSIGELAQAVGVESRLLLAWEAGDLFPTKRHVDKLLAARDAGPAGVTRRRSAAPVTPQGVDLLKDPRLWAIVHALVEDPDFFVAVEKLLPKK